MDLRIILLLFISTISIEILGQKVTISGYITDDETGERLINANIYEANTQKGTAANNYGFYSLSLPKGNVTLLVSYIGYTSQTHSFNLKKDSTINVKLNLNADAIEEVKIVGHNNEVEETQMSMIEVPIQKLQNLPVILGEADVLKVMQLLPGVKGGTEGTSGIYVRGGGSDQNLFLLDGVPVYNANHLLGFFSVFNPDAIKSLKVYKGGFPAHYGGRLSSVIDITMKDGNMKKLEGNYSIGLISSKLSLEGPIKKDNTSFIISARRTYIDILAQPLLVYINSKNDEGIKAGAWFHDLNLKVNHIFSERSRLCLSAYYGQDKGYNGTENSKKNVFEGTQVNHTSKNRFGLGWGNAIASLRWNYLINKKMFSNTTLTYSKYHFDVSFENIENDLITKNKVENFFKYYSGIKDVSAKVDFDYFPLAGHEVKFGVQLIDHLFSPGVSQIRYENRINDTTNALDSVYGNLKIIANEYSAYLEDVMMITADFRINAGVHLSLFNVQDENYLRLQPRLSLRYKVAENWSLKASYSRMVQHVHLLTTAGISMPTDLWLPVTKKFEPPFSDQFAIGSVIILPNHLSLTIEGFYKSMQNLIEYKEGASFTGTATDWENKVEKGNGWSYGAEWMLEKNIGQTTGWIAYTLSWSKRQFDLLNFGNPFPAKYDSRHDVSVVLSHKFSNKMDIGLTWIYQTGNAVTLGTMKYLSAKIPGINAHFQTQYEVTDYNGRNNYRMPPYHRMDVGLNFHKQKKHGLRTWNISAYNAYSRQNPFIIIWDTKSVRMNEGSGQILKDKTILTQYSLFPIIPSISYSFKF
ncbi:MAG: TonB-dependent receptor [Prolixibacteraceae bacterium]|nr:TonB-dependent receptor [Prolixibacteraceae bacterium]